MTRYGCGIKARLHRSEQPQQTNRSKIKMLTNAKCRHPTPPVLAFLSCKYIYIYKYMFHVLLILLSNLPIPASIKPFAHLTSDKCYPVAARSLWGDNTLNTHSPSPLFQGCPAMACKAHRCELSHESMYWRLVQWSVLHASRPNKRHHVDPQITNDVW